MIPSEFLAALTSATGLPGFLTGNGVAITLLGLQRYTIELDDLITMTAAPRQAGATAVPCAVEVERDEPGMLEALVACIQLGERKPEPMPEFENTGPESTIYAAIGPAA